MFNHDGDEDYSTRKMTPSNKANDVEEDSYLDLNQEHPEYDQNNAEISSPSFKSIKSMRSAAIQALLEARKNGIYACTSRNIWKLIEARGFVSSSKTPYSSMSSILSSDVKRDNSHFEIVGGGPKEGGNLYALKQGLDREALRRFLEKINVQPIRPYRGTNSIEYNFQIGIEKSPEERTQESNGHGQETRDLGPAVQQPKGKRVLPESNSMSPEATVKKMKIDFEENVYSPVVQRLLRQIESNLRIHHKNIIQLKEDSRITEEEVLKLTIFEKLSDKLKNIEQEVISLVNYKDQLKVIVREKEFDLLESQNSNKYLKKQLTKSMEFETHYKCEIERLEELNALQKKEIDRLRNGDADDDEEIATNQGLFKKLFGKWT